MQNGSILIPRGGGGDETAKYAASFLATRFLSIAIFSLFFSLFLFFSQIDEMKRVRAYNVNHPRALIASERLFRSLSLSLRHIHLERVKMDRPDYSRDIRPKL